jgi:hypothetical protein
MPIIFFLTPSWLDATFPVLAGPTRTIQHTVKQLVAEIDQKDKDKS